ncbi:hypothetical protein WA026_000885 [Henosepilachna vigintioctopunctata]|uniref:Neural Wiskott-Aldrich syndrome protein n=1 Tax=Henosepilachna vigintioctopunctata TaxID=420089 RepID=A0AAW1UZ35_9CUCU
MKMPPTVEVENKPSKLLNSDENNQIFRLLGNRCQTLSTTVIQLFLTEPPSHTQWIRKDTGVLCFVKDNIKKSYFFRLLCLRRNNLIWEHEMYHNLEYVESTSFFHIFEGQDCLVSFNFANIEEAKDMKKIVDFKVYAKRKKEERRRVHNSNSYTRNINNSLRPTNPQDFVVKKIPDLAAKQAKRRRNITKADIGSPRDFKHLSHVGWNPNSGFDLDGVDDQLRKFFAKAGVSEKELQDKETRDFIYGFINERGGYDAVKKENTESVEIIKPNSNLAPASPLSVPPVPPRGPGKPHVRAAPPPPPSGPPGRLSTKVIQEKSSLPNQNDHFTSSPAPPPPPLPSSLLPPTLQQDGQSDNSKPSPMDMNSALLQSIRNGTTLKPVEEKKVAVVEARNDLLCEIRKGFSLKPVQEREMKQLNQGNETGSTDLAGALARALAERSKAIHSEDDDSEDEDSNDDEWDC